MNNYNSEKTAQEILTNFAAPNSSIVKLIAEIAARLTTDSAAVEVCAFSDHQNGLSVLRHGNKPSKEGGAKQSFSFPMNWNSWLEADGIGDEVVNMRLIIRGEISSQGKEFLTDLQQLLETLGAGISKPVKTALWSNRSATQVKWGMMAAGEKSYRLLTDIELFADSRMPVLIMGETGCGKELVANALHTASHRKGRFFAVNCAAIPKELIESELFGHRKGAYTGANDTRDGYFQAAHEGTLFLDEIGELSLDLQAKLLRVLQENKVRRVGSNIDEEVKIRVVAATNRNLAEMVKAGEFRADLYYRLHGLMLKLAPLRERREEIPQLIEFLLKKLSEELGREITLDSMALRRLMRHDFPGNVRELVNLLEAGAVYAQKGIIEIQHLRINGEIEDQMMPELLPEETEYSQSSANASIEENLIRIFSGKTYDEIQIEISKVIFSHALENHDGQISGAAASLGMERSTLSRMIKKLGLQNNKSKEVIGLNLNLGRAAYTAAQQSAAAA